MKMMTVARKSLAKPTNKKVTIVTKKPKDTKAKVPAGKSPRNYA